MPTTSAPGIRCQWPAKKRKKWGDQPLGDLGEALRGRGGRAGLAGEPGRGLRRGGIGCCGSGRDEPGVVVPPPCCPVVPCPCAPVLPCPCAPALPCPCCLPARAS